MASGVEVAGLVLGSIPLILAGLQFYAEGISVTKRYGKYREEVGSLLVELRAENTLYINSINMLLIGVVGQAEMAAFLADPKGARWKEAHFDRKLQKRLDTSYESYFETINQLMMTIERFKERLRLDSSGKVSYGLFAVSQNYLLRRLMWLHRCRRSSQTQTSSRSITRD
jgi:hypothetical protein